MPCALTLAILILAACSPMPGAWGLQPGIERVHDLSEIEVLEHPGTVLGTAATCNGIYWREGAAGKLGVILTLGHDRRLCGDQRHGTWRDPMV